MDGVDVIILLFLKRMKNKITKIDNNLIERISGNILLQVKMSLSNFGLREFTPLIPLFLSPKIKNLLKLKYD